MPFETVTLPNGLRLVLVPVAQSPAVTVLSLVGTGSKYEEKRVSGISHFLEHMCFKGTDRRPRAIDISRELDAIGAHYNAFTSQEYTGYYAKVDHRHFDIALDVVSDIYVGSTFPQAEIDKEKGVIIEEINMYRDVPQYHVHDVYLDLLFGDQPAGWSIAGTKETVSAMTHDDFAAYHTRHYVSQATVVVIAGRFNRDEAIAKATAAFAAVPAGAQVGKERVIEKQSAPGIRIDERSSDQAHLVLGVRTFDTYDPRNPTLRVLASVLGGGMSSRLFEKLRNELGICYYVSGDADSYTDHGSFDISAGVDSGRVPVAVSAIIDELVSVRDVLVPEDELRKAKSHLSGSLALSLETSHSLANFYGGQEVLRKPMKTPADLTAEIEQVSAEDVRSLARAIVLPERLNLAIVGAVKDRAATEQALRLP